MGRSDINIEVCLCNLKESDHLENTAIDGKEILRGFFKIRCVHVNWIGLPQLGTGGGLL
jgi:hypothetical protein